MDSKINIVILILIPFLYSCNEVEKEKLEKQHESEWGYRGECSPTKWHNLSDKYELCQKGEKQSPINVGIDTTHANHSLEVKYKNSHEYIVNNGHSVEMLYDNGSHITFDNTLYDLVQFHFHTPSEHHIKDKTFPAEIHLVHRSPEGAHLVISLLLKSGDFNPLIDKIIKNAPKEKGENEKMDVINIGNIYPDNPHYYFYEGSFTTPPCTENVKWVIHKKQVELSSGQLSKLLSKEGFNARPIQKIYDRKVEVF